MKFSRREILTSSLGAAVSSVVATMPVSAATIERRHLIGHTGITWGYSPQNVIQAISDVGRLGFHGFESFGSVLEYWEDQGGLREQLQEAGLPLIGAYCPMVLTDANQRSIEVAKVVRWGKLIKKYGGNIAVIGPDNVDRSTYDFNANRSTVIESLNAMGQALHDIGITAALHQHTGSCITTRDETYAVMNTVNTEYMKLCPDTGELLAGGVDPVQTVKDFLDVIAHVHIKDYSGGTTHDGYTTVGAGQVNVAGVLDVLETSDTNFMIMTELNPDFPSNENNPNTPYERAASSKAAFIDLGYKFL